MGLCDLALNLLYRHQEGTVMAIDSDYVQQMSTQLATYEVQSSLDRLNRNETSYKAQRDALSSLRSSLTTFKSAITKLNSSTSSMLSDSTPCGQEDGASATEGRKAVSRRYESLVRRLASKGALALQGLTDAKRAGARTLTTEQLVASFDVDRSGLTP